MSADLNASKLAHVPVSLFASVMGVAGLGLAWRKAAGFLNIPAWIGEALLLTSAMIFMVAAITYLIKSTRHFDAVKAEFNHPIRSPFFSAVPISLLLISSALIPHLPILAEGMWVAGASLQLALTIRMLSRWMLHKQNILHANPAWFIPIIGNIIVPIAGVGFGYVEASWFFWSIGMVFWLPLLTIILYRVMFHDALPPKLTPTLFILLPPPAIGYLSHHSLTGGGDQFSQLLVNSALFFTLVLAAKGKRFLGLPFAMSWWAYTFPLDAAALAFLEHSHSFPNGFWPYIAAASLAAATIAVAAVGFKTLVGIAQGDLFVPE